MEPVKTVLQPIKKGLDVLTKRIKDMQKLLDNLEDALTSEKGKARAKKKPSKASATDTVLKIVQASRTGVTTPQIKKKTRFSDTKIQGIIYRLKKQKKIKTKGRGVYVKA